MPYCRLSRRVREHGRVKKRSQRTFDRLRASVRKSLKQGDQNPRWVERLIAIEIVFAARERLEAAYECSGNADRLFASFPFWRLVDCPRDEASDVSGNPIGCLSVAEGDDLCEQGAVRQLCEEVLKPACKQCFVQTWP
jgi:hypothetical protein